MWKKILFSFTALLATGGAQKRCKSTDLYVPEVPLTTEPISQIRTIVGNCEADIKACPLGGCRFDARLDERCPLDGVWCPTTETQKIECGSLGVFPVQFVTSCTCCQSEGLQITGRVLDSVSGIPIRRVLVRINKKTKAKSGSNGEFAALQPSSTTRIVISASLKKSEYIATTKVLDIAAGTKGPLDVTILMVKMAEPITVDPTVDNKIPLVTGEVEAAMIGLPSGSIQRKRGEAYTDTVKVSINYIDTSNRSVEDVIPGQFLTGNRRGLDPLITDGIFALTLRGKTGEDLRANEAVVRVRGGMRLWTLSNDGIWRVMSGSGRRKRQIALTEEFIVNINSATWVNIDKIPGAPPCYFKARVFDDVIDVEIPPSSTAAFLPTSIGYTTLNQRLRFYHSYTNTPASSCHEVRCPSISDPDDMLVGLIGLKAYENVVIGGVTFPFVTQLQPRVLADYHPALLPSLGIVHYAVVPDDQIYVNFISDASGPFYTTLSSCEASTIDDPSFQFYKPQLPSYVPYPDDTPLCTARIGFFGEGNFFDALDKIGYPPTVSALSTWQESGTSYYYTDSSPMACSSVGGEFMYVCLAYRCSTDEEKTIVLVDIDIPVIPAGNLSDRDTQAFYCQPSNCVTDDCKGGVAEVSIDGSVEAPVVTENAPDFYPNTANDCADQPDGAPFALTFDCYARNSG